MRSLTARLIAPATLACQAQPVLPQDETTPLAAVAPDNAWVIRGLADFSPATRIRLAQEGEPSWYQINADGLSLRLLFDAVCGKQGDEAEAFLMKRALGLNLIEDAYEPIARGKVVALPFCLKVDEDVSVEVQKDQDVTTILDDVYGVSGPKTIDKTYTLNRSTYRSLRDLTRHLRIGFPLRVPYASEKVVFRAQDGGTADPLEIVREIEPPSVVQQAELVFSDRQGQLENRPSGPPPPPALASYASGTVYLVAAVAMDPVKEAEVCGVASATPFRPFDIAEVLRAYEVSAALRDKRPYPNNRPSRVGLIDTGLAGFRDEFFAEKFFFANEYEKDGGNDGKNNDPAGKIAFNFTDDIYGANINMTGEFAPWPDTFRDRAHGTQMGSLILGGPEGVSEWLSKAMQSPIQIKVFNFTRSIPAGTEMAKAHELPTAIAYLADAGAQTISMSLATSYDMHSLGVSMETHKDVLFVVAAGNGRPGLAPVGVDLGINQDIVPASYGGQGPLLNVISVGASGYQGRRAKFSNFSSDNVDFLAPGCGIPVRAIDAGPTRISGTSPAAAITAFGAALVRALAPTNAKPIDIRNRLIVSTDYDPALHGEALMPGRLNLVKALSLYKDIIEVRGEPENLYIYGDVVEGRHFLRACIGTELYDLPESQIQKIVPNVKVAGERTKMIVWFKSFDGLKSRECIQSTDPLAGSWRLGTISSEGSSDPVPPLQDIKEIVFSSY